MFVYSAAHAPATRGGQVGGLRRCNPNGVTAYLLNAMVRRVAGDNCSTAVCPKDCNGNGMCDTATGRCICFPGFGGRACGTLLCAGLVCCALLSCLVCCALLPCLVRCALLPLPAAARRLLRLPCASTLGAF